MTKPTSLRRQAREIRDKIVALRDEGRTIQEIVAALDTLSVKTSKSAVHRLLQREAKVADRLRASRELAQSIGRQFGDAENSVVARTNIELLHDALMSVLSAVEEGKVLKAGEIMALAISVEKLTKASKTDFEKELKVALEQERRKTQEQAAAAIEATGRKQGLSAETIEAFKRSVFGKSE